ncbi:hypothetical protein DVH24_034148 [Malus domestica]|uniref:Uncharacterized protein n=1 Tax=Malus domestica TaxID=3750 RepID=A0A498IBI4_MALDO|nr:hypothetical protein DVH24_034148 [Malus domestica]
MEASSILGGIGNSIQEQLSRSLTWMTLLIGLSCGFALKTLYYGKYLNYGHRALTSGQVRWWDTMHQLHQRLHKLSLYDVEPKDNPTKGWLLM